MVLININRIFGASNDTVKFDLVLWAHGLHLLFFPVGPVYNIDVCLDRLPSIPQNLRAFENQWFAGDF